MAFPTITESGGADSANGTSRAITLPSVVAGDLIIVVVESDGSATQTWTYGGSTTAFTQLHNTANGTTMRMVTKYRKIVSGDSGTLTLATSASEGCAWTVLKIPVGMWDGTAAPVCGTAATGTSVSPNPPSVTPAWGAAQALWVAVAAWDSSGSVSAIPTGWTATTQRRWASTNGGGVYAIHASSVLATMDPGTFTMTSAAWVAQTIVIKPAKSLALPIIYALTQADDLLAFDDFSLGQFASGSTVSIEGHRVEGGKGTTWTKYGMGVDPLSISLLRDDVVDYSGGSWTDEYYVQGVDLGNGYIRAKISPMVGYPGGECHIIFRGDDALGDDIWYEVEFYDDLGTGPLTTHLFSCDGGTYTELAAGTGAYDDGPYVKITVSGVSPTTINVYLSTTETFGTAEISLSDNTAANQVASGFVGLWLDSLVGDLLLDKFTIVEQGTAETSIYGLTAAIVASTPTLTLGLLDAGSAIYAPTLVPKSTLTLGLLDAGSAIYAPTLVPKSTLTLGLLDAGSAIYAPTLVPKSTLTLGLLDAGSAIYAPTLLPQPVAIVLGLLDAGSAIYAPTLLPQPVAIVLGLLDAGSAIYAPTLVPKSTLTLGLLDAGSAIYAPTLVPKSTLTLGLLDAGSAIYEFTVASGGVSGQTVGALDLLDGGSAIYALVLVKFLALVPAVGVAVSPVLLRRVGKTVPLALSVTPSGINVAQFVRSVAVGVSVAVGRGRQVGKSAAVSVTMALGQQRTFSLVRAIGVDLALSSKRAISLTVPLAVVVGAVAVRGLVFSRTVALGITTAVMGVTNLVIHRGVMTGVAVTAGVSKTVTYYQPGSAPYRRWFDAALRQLRR